MRLLLLKKPCRIAYRILDLPEALAENMPVRPLSLSKLRGKWHNYKSINTTNTINVLASYHPAYLLRSPQFKKDAWIDLKILREKINNEN